MSTVTGHDQTDQTARVSTIELFLDLDFFVAVHRASRRFNEMGLGPPS
jgi:hypothetical protein